MTYKKPLIRFTYKIPISIVLTTDDLAGYFARILRKNTDFAVTVYGEKGVGKSISTAEIIRKICKINEVPFFSKEQPDLIKSSIVFYKRDFYHAVKTAPTYSAIMLDDFGSELDPRRSMEKSAINISHHLHTSRTLKKGYFITTPTAGWINKDTRDRASNYFIWITNKNEEKGFCTARVFYLQKNEIKRKIYTHNLFLSTEGYINNRGVGNPIKTWVLYPLPKDLESIYTPYRIEKGEINLQKGLDELEEEERENKKYISPQEIVKEILTKKDRYLRKLKTKDEYRWDKGLISADYNIGSKKIEQIVSLLRIETSIE